MPTRPDSDRWLFGVTLALCLFGAVMILSASAVTAEQLYGHSYIFLVRQAAWLLLGLLGMFVLMRTDYHKLRQPAVIYAVLSTVLVMLVSAFFLDRSHATHRWIRFGPVGIQPSELAKLAVILYLAWFLDLKRRDQDAMEFCKEGFLDTVLPAFAPILVCAGLILAQPDLGTSLDILLFATTILFVAGLSWKWIATGVAVALPALYLLITLAPYRMTRFLSFWDPGSDPQGAGFQLRQSLIAVGSGGLTGVGLMESKQKLFYLPGTGDRAVCRLRTARHSRRFRRAGRVWPFARPGRHDHGVVAGAHQLRGGSGNGSDQRHSPAIHQLWRVKFASDAAGHRRAAQYFAASQGSLRSGRVT